MRYLLLIYTPEEDPANVPPDPSERRDRRAYSTSQGEV